MYFDVNIIGESDSDESLIEEQDAESSSEDEPIIGREAANNNHINQCRLVCCRERCSSLSSSSESSLSSDETSDQSFANEDVYEGSDESVMEQSENEEEPIDIDVEDFPQTQNSERLQTHADKSCIMVGYLLVKYAWSKKELEDVINVMNQVFISHCPVTAASVWSYVRDLGNQCLTEKINYCCECRQKLPSDENKMCQNRLCSRSGKPVKNGSKTSPIRLMHYSVERQLRHIITPVFGDIVSNHRKCHLSEQVPLINDVRTRSIYKSKIETSEQFTENKITLVLTASFDGARPAKLTKREVTPLVLRIESLEKSLRNLEENYILSTMHISSQGVKKEDMELFTSRFTDELEHLMFNGFLFLHDGIEWTVVINVIGVLSDMKGSRCINGLPDWQRFYGCNVCLTPGQRFHSTMSFNQLTDASLRTVDSCLEDMRNRQNGHTQIEYCKFAYYFVAVLLFIDLFHIRKEGVVKKAVTEVVKSTWKWSTFRNGRNEPVELALKDTKSMTDETDLLSLQSIGTATGSQIQAIGLVALPLAALTRSYSDSSYGFFVLCILSVIWNEEDADTYNILQEILDCGLQLYVKKEPTHVTLKAHTYFKHQILHLKTYGVRFDMEPFEKLHSKFQSNINYKGTNLFETYGNRFLAKSSLRHSLNSMLLDQHGNFRFVVEQLLNKSYDSSFCGIVNEISKEQVKDDHKNTLATFCNIADIAKFGSRIKVTKINGKPVTIESDTYWRSKKTTSSVFRKMTGDGDKYLEALLFFELNGTLKVIAKEFKTVPLKYLIRNLLEDVRMSDESAAVIHLCSQITEKFQNIDAPFERILGHKIHIHDVSDIKDRAVIVPFENDNFVAVYH